MKIEKIKLLNTLEDERVLTEKEELRELSRIKQAVEKSRNEIKIKLDRFYIEKNKDTNDKIQVKSKLEKNEKIKSDKMALVFVFNIKHNIERVNFRAVLTYEKIQQAKNFKLEEELRKEEYIQKILRIKQSLAIKVERFFD